MYIRKQIKISINQVSAIPPNWCLPCDYRRPRPWSDRHPGPESTLLAASHELAQCILKVLRVAGTAHLLGERLEVAAHLAGTHTVHLFPNFLDGAVTQSRDGGVNDREHRPKDAGATPGRDAESLTDHPFILPLAEVDNLLGVSTGVLRDGGEGRHDGNWY